MSSRPVDEPGSDGRGGTAFAHHGEVARPRAAELLERAPPVAVPPATFPQPVSSTPIRVEPRPKGGRRRFRVGIVLAAPVVIAAVVMMLLYRMSSDGAPGSTQRDARPDSHPVQARTVEPISQPARAAAPVPQCTDALELSGRWLATTTVAGAIRRIQSVNGWYAFEFDRDPCQKGVTIEKTGYEDTVFEPEKVQRGHASVERVGQWGAHEVLEARVSLARDDGQQAIHRLFRFIRVDEDTLVGEWRQVDDAWDKHGMWGYFVARQGASSSP